MNALYPLGCPVILDTQSFERKSRQWEGELEPHQYVGTVSGFATLINDGCPTFLYVVTLCSLDRFEDPTKPHGAHISNILVDESALLHDTRAVQS